MDVRRGRAGAQRSKWWRPTGECKPGFPVGKADRPTGPAPQSSASLAGFKNEWALLPHRVRGLDRVRLHAELAILAKLACALANGASSIASCVANNCSYRTRLRIAAHIRSEPPVMAPQTMMRNVVSLSLVFGATLAFLLTR